MRARDFANELAGMSMSGIVAFLESDPFGTGTLFFERAGDLGLRPILICTEQGSCRFLAEFERVKLFEMNQVAVLDVIDRLGRDRVRGVWSVRDGLAGLAARVSMAIGRQCIDPTIIGICHDKFKAREALAQAGLNNVQFMLAQSGEEAAEAACTLGGRVVVKPRKSTGSDGVRLCCSPEEARHHFGALVERLPDVRRSGALVEAAVDGRQFSVQIFDGRSIGVTRQDVGSPPAFITVALDFPWSDDARVHGEIVKHAEQAIAAVGHSRGPGCVDIRYNSQGPHVIEINPRLAGEMIPENIRLATGIDIVEATIRFVCGMPYDLAPRKNRGSATRWLLHPGSPVGDVLGRDEAASVAGVVHVRLFPQWFGGGRVNSYKDRLAFVIAEADSAAKAGEIAELGLHQLRIKPAKAIKRWRLIGASNVISEARRRVMALVQRIPSAQAIRCSPLLSHSIVRDEMSFNALESEWQDLFRRARVQTPFLRYSWSRLCWERQRNFLERSLFIVIVRKNDRPVLIAPFLLRPRRWSWRLLFLDSPTPQYNDVLVEDSAEAPEYVDYLWGILAGMPDIECFVSKWVRDDSLLVEHLAIARQASKAASYRAPYIDLTKFGDWEGYWHSLTPELRQDHTWRLRDLEKRGRVELRMANGNSWSTDMAWLLAQERRRHEERGKSSTGSKAREAEEFFTEAAREGIDSGRTWLMVLSVDGETIASSLGFREGSTLYMSKVAYDPAWRTYSPGRTLNLLTIQRAFQEGLEKCDMMTGRDSLKDELATGAIQVRKREICL